MCLHIHIHICIHIYIYIYLAQHLVYSKYSVNDSDYYNQHYFTLSSSSRLCWYHVHTTFTSHCTYPPALAVEYQQLTAASFSRDLLYSIETICSLGDYGSLSPRDSLQPMTDPYAETKGYLPWLKVRPTIKLRVIKLSYSPAEFISCLAFFLFCSLHSLSPESTPLINYLDKSPCLRLCF